MVDIEGCSSENIEKETLPEGKHSENGNEPSENVDDLVVSNEEKSSKDETSQLSPTQIYVKKSLEIFHKNSNLNFRQIPEITFDELNVGKELGKGGFGLVKEANWQGKSYALKMLIPEVVQGDASTFKIGASDLIKEAEFLSAISHPNIIGIHAKRTTDIESNFILVDLLKETLYEKMTSWRKWDAKIQKSQNLRLKLQQEGVQVALGICEALLHLHNQSIVYRDLKMSNVGFDRDGNVKIFDFGIAKELKDGDKSNTGKYKLSGKTGSLAYMAPEVAKNWKYDKMVDVYSFGILLWEIAALKPAFPGYDTPKQMQSVWSGDERPPMERWWHVELQWLMKKCWSYFAKERPDFGTVKETLEEILEEEEEEEEQSIRNVRSFGFGSRRSQRLSVDADAKQSMRSVPGGFFGNLSRRKPNDSDSDRSSSQRRLIFSRSSRSTDNESQGNENQDTNENCNHVHFDENQNDTENQRFKPEHPHKGAGKSVIKNYHSERGFSKNSEKEPRRRKQSSMGKLLFGSQDTENNKDVGNNGNSQSQQQPKKVKQEKNKKPSHGKLFFGLF